MQVGWVKIRHFRRKMCYNSFTNGCSVGFRYAKNPLAAGADPTEELTTFHRPLIVGEGDTSPNAPLPSRGGQHSICRGVRGFNPPLVEDDPHTGD